MVIDSSRDSNDEGSVSTLHPTEPRGAQKTILCFGILNDKKIPFFDELSSKLRRFGYALKWIDERPIPGYIRKVRDKLSFEVLTSSEELPRYRRNVEGRASTAAQIQSFPTLYHQAALLQAEHDQLSVREAFEELLAYRRYIDDVVKATAPSLVLPWHQFRGRHYHVADVARRQNIPCLFTEFGLLPGTISFDADGQMGESRVAERSACFRGLPIYTQDRKNAEAMIDRIRRCRLHRRTHDNAEEDVSVVVERARKNGQKIIFYAGQNDTYAGLIPRGCMRQKRHSPLYVDSIDALKHLAVLASKNNWHVVFKPHPIAVQRGVIRRESIPHSNHVSIIESGDFVTCIEAADVCTTILSQSAYMFMIYEKATVLLGCMQLKGKGCVWEPEKRNDVEGMLQKAFRDGFTPEARSNFVQHVAQLCRYHLYAMPTNEVESQVMDLLRGRDASSVAKRIVRFIEWQDQTQGFPFEPDERIQSMSQVRGALKNDCTMHKVTA